MQSRLFTFGLGGFFGALSSSLYTSRQRFTINGINDMTMSGDDFNNLFPNQALYTCENLRFPRSYENGYNKNVEVWTERPKSVPYCIDETESRRVENIPSSATVTINSNQITISETILSHAKNP